MSDFYWFSAVFLTFFTKIVLKIDENWYFSIKKTWEAVEVSINVVTVFRFEKFLVLGWLMMVLSSFRTEWTVGNRENDTAKSTEEEGTIGWWNWGFEEWGRGEMHRNSRKMVKLMIFKIKNRKLALKMWKIYEIAHKLSICY